MGFSYNMLNPISYKTYQPTFNANLASPRLKSCAEDFFIKIEGYGKDKFWAEEIVETTESATRMIWKNKDIEKILFSISLSVAAANKSSTDISKAIKSGVLRTFRPDWIGTDEKEVFTPYEKGRYSVYKDRLNEIYEKPLKEINNKIGMTRPNGKEDIQHGEAKKINSSLDYIFELFNKNIKPYTDGSATKDDLKNITDSIAEIRWILAHSTPWLRGSDAISNVLMRALFKSVGIKAYPPAENISYDFEAYCRDLQDYKDNFSSFFEKPLEIIE